MFSFPQVSPPKPVHTSPLPHTCDIDKFTKIKFHDNPLCGFGFDVGAETGKMGFIYAFLRDGKELKVLKKNPLAVAATVFFLQNSVYIYISNRGTFLETEGLYA